MQTMRQVYLRITSITNIYVSKYKETHNSRGKKPSESEGTTRNQEPKDKTKGKITLQFYRLEYFNSLVSNAQPSSFCQLWNFHNSTLRDLGVTLRRYDQ